MTIFRRIRENLRTAAILFTWVAPLALQAGPVAGELAATRQVNRLLDEYSGEGGELPQELVLQCHLISLVSDAVTLRAAALNSDRDGAGGVPAYRGESEDVNYPLLDVTPQACELLIPTTRRISDEQPLGP